MNPSNSRLLQHLAGVVALAFALTGCLAGNALRGVGAPATAPASPSTQTASAVSQMVPEAPDATLANGTSLNLAQPAATSQAKPKAAIPPTPIMAGTREAGVTEIRQKAAATGDAPPNVFDIPTPNSEMMTPEQQAKVRAELEAAAARNAAIVSDADAKAKASTTNSLKKRAATHYDDALNAIEN